LLVCRRLALQYSTFPHLPHVSCPVPYLFSRATSPTVVYAVAAWSHVDPTPITSRSSCPCSAVPAKDQ
jgi:hypothetical protein